MWVHGWLWNRVGNVAGRVPFVDRDVDFLPGVVRHPRALNITFDRA